MTVKLLKIRYWRIVKDTGYCLGWETSGGNWDFSSFMHLFMYKPSLSITYNNNSLWKRVKFLESTHIKGTQEWEFFWLRFWILYYFFVSYVKILRFCKKNFLIGPVLEEVRFFRVVLGLRGMKKNFELGQKNIFLFFYLWTLYMS